MRHHVVGAQPQHALSHHLTEPCLLIAEGYYDQASSFVTEAARRIEAAGEGFTELAASGDFWNTGSAFLDSLRPYEVKDGVLSIPVRGALLGGFPYAFGSWATGYEYIEAAFDRGLADDNVKGIALMVNSPGGAVAGLFELTDKMREMRASSDKPVNVFAQFACSAAYAISCVADEIVIGKTSIVGSIGVMTYHVDISEALKKQGVAVTYIYAGKYKVEGNETEPLSKAAKDRIQARIDHIYNLFVGDVAKGRDMTEEAVRATEALTYFSEGAINAGLADREESLSDALISFREGVNSTKGTTAMNYTKEQYDAAVAAAREDGRKEGEASAAAAVTAAKGEGAKAERARVSAIVTSDAAKGKLATALALALGDDAVSPETASKVLATVSGEAPKADKGNAFEEAMDKTQNPNVGSDAAKGGKGDDDDVAQIIGDFNAVTGKSIGVKK